MRRTHLIIGASALALALLLGAFAFLTSRPPLPSDDDDLGLRIAAAFASAQAHPGSLEPAKRISRVVMDSGGVMERSAPSFAPHLLQATGARGLTLLGRQAAYVQYEGDEGPLALISLPGTLEDLPLPAGEARFQGRTFRTLKREGPAGAALTLVAFAQGTRLVVLVGPQRLESLLPLAWLIPARP